MAKDMTKSLQQTVEAAVREGLGTEIVRNVFCEEGFDHDDERALFITVVLKTELSSAELAKRTLPLPRLVASKLDMSNGFLFPYIRPVFEDGEAA